MQFHYFLLVLFFLYCSTEFSNALVLLTNTQQSTRSLSSIDQHCGCCQSAVVQPDGIDRMVHTAAFSLLPWLLCPVCRSEGRAAATGHGAAPSAAVPAAALPAAAVAAAPVRGASSACVQAAARRRRVWHACPTRTAAAPWSAVAAHAAPSDAASDAAAEEPAISGEYDCRSYAAQWHQHLQHVITLQQLQPGLQLDAMQCCLLSCMHLLLVCWLHVLFCKPL